MCEEGGLDGNFTNHSGKRTCATALYQAGVEEQEIMNRTGHRSIESVRQYKRSSDEMLKEISSVLEPKRVKTEASAIPVSVDPPATPVSVDPPTPLFAHCTFNFSAL